MEHKPAEDHPWKKWKQHKHKMPRTLTPSRQKLFVEHTIEQAKYIEDVVKRAHDELLDF